MKVQRLRIRFARGEQVKFITHLDLMRLWERALRRANIDLAYSEGFTPHPRLSLAAPLAVGVTSSAEILDLFLNSRISPLEFARQVANQLPPGVEVLEVQEVGLRAPSVQSEVRWAEYQVRLESSLSAESVQGVVDAFLAAESIPWEHQRDKEARKYDIRALVHDLWLEQSEGGLMVGMCLRADNNGSGRPEQVISAMGLPEPDRIHRSKLILAESSPAHEAWRRHGRFT